MAFAQQVKRKTGHELGIQFNTAPQIAKRLASGAVYDILISPPAVIEQAARDGRGVGDTRVPVGRVGAGVIVRTGASSPDITKAFIRYLATPAVKAIFAAAGID